MSSELQTRFSEYPLPAHAFPGDEAIASTVYGQCITSGYISSVSTISGAARGFGLAIDTETLERWKRVGSAAGLLDDFLDESPDQESAYYLYEEGLAQAFTDPVNVATNVQLPQWASDLLLPSVSLLGNSVAVMQPKDTAVLVDSAKQVGDIARRKAQCKDIHDYIRLLKLESFHTSALIHGTASSGVRQQPGYKSFVRWTQNAMELGTLADSARDIWADKDAGRTDVDATIINSARIALQLRRPYREMIYSRSSRAATIRSLLARSVFYL